MKSDHEVRNGRVHRKEVGAGGPPARSADAFCSCTFKMQLILRNYEYIIRRTKGGGGGGGGRAPGAGLEPPLVLTTHPSPIWSREQKGSPCLVCL